MSMETRAAPARRRGRPLGFDRDAALHQAMLLFWRHGYEGTSIAALTEAMGITPPSIYAAFGDKKGLFLEAVRRYTSGAVTSESIVAGATTARDAAWGLLKASASCFTGEETPPGCLLASAAISGSSESADVQAELAAMRRRTEALLHERIIGDMEAGALRADVQADTLAAHVMAVIQGLSTLARDGATRDKLLRVAAFAMTTWPDAPGPTRSARRALHPSG